jgi:8-oxo-dGTP pyrophosphatase MutT (NUDIX family)
MVKRSARMAFMPDAHVFPGGRVDESDSVLPLFGGASDRSRIGGDGAGALQAAAIRETFEEAGVLLARGGAPSVEDRQALLRGALGFEALVARRGLHLDADAIRLWSWWITPQIESRRYSTRFFVAKAPDAAEASHDDGETVQSAWWTPAEALAKFEAGQVQLAPPTFVTLRELLPYEQAADVLAAAAGRRVVPIEPTGAVHEDGSVTIYLPGDPLHPSQDRVDGPTRVTLRQGRWLVHR